ISQSFGPDTAGSGRPNPDISLVSNDFVGFYADKGTLLRLSNNDFKGLLSPPGLHDKEEQIIFLQNLPSSELDLLLQAIYTVPASP
ncbi:hypothetical protein MPER_00197, partial [Moniliophthora perniciosa FA553]